jgi:PAS domain S-box-containing protein
VGARVDHSANAVVALWRERAAAARRGKPLPTPAILDRLAADYRTLLDALLRGAFDPIALNARDSQEFLEVSDSFCTLTGFSREELLGRTSTELALVAPDQLRTEIQRRVSEGRAGLYETRLRRKGGEIRVVELSHTLVQANQLVLTVIRDITGRPRSQGP